MKKRIGILVLLAALCLSGCAGSMPLDILEKMARSSSETGEASAPEEDGNGTWADEETSDEKRGGFAAENGEDTEGRDISGGNPGREDAAEDGNGPGEEAADQDGENDSYERGIITEDGWESELWNLRFTAPEGIFMLNEEGIETLMGIGGEIVSENYTERQQEYIEMANVYEMVGMTADGNANVAVTAEKLLMMGMETDDYKKAVLLQLRLMKTPVYTILDEEGTAEIAGETYAVVKTIAEGGDEYYQDYYIRVDGDKAMAIIMTYKEDTVDKVGEILAGFDVY